MAEQVERLKTRFGEKAFDPESVRLIFREVSELTDREFAFLVDALISTRAHNRPPLVLDFKEARLKIQKRVFEAQLSQAASQMNSPNPTGLKAYLAKEFPGCKTLNEAIAVRRHQIQIARAEDPNYDPMTDPKWMGVP